MVWGYFSIYGLGPLVQVDGRIDSKDYVKILETCYVPYLNNLINIVGQNNYMFQDDNAKIHTSKFTERWFHENNIVRLPWPSYSPDLNSIEHLWDELEHRICKHIPLPSNESELF